MKPQYCVIALSLVLASVTMPALQAKADEDIQAPTPAWQKGYADGTKCVVDAASCKFVNPYMPKTDEAGKTLDDQDLNTLAINSSDYVAGFIVGKSASTK